ncbi:MAG: peptide deformylase [Candidatus Pacebacteria bacterium]|nr:peptide deformylase [Candidatus Paceibacterota bacterium]
MEVRKDLKFLRQKSEPVLEIDGSIRDLVDQMVDVIDLERGAGLAAPQVGVLKRLVLVRFEDNEIVPFINPIILERGSEKDIVEEGCLSLPDQLVNVKRPTYVRVRFLDIEGNTIECDLEGLEARIIQHEIDHLNGTLIIDYISLVDKIKKIFN